MDKAQVSKWIEDNWSGSRECNVCGSDDWIILENVWELPSFQGGRPVLPVVALMCNVCGHTIFFNAIAVGAVKKE